MISPPKVIVVSVTALTLTDPVSKAADWARAPGMIPCPAGAVRVGWAYPQT